jgi:sec-independent protein translocase protein TatA
MAHCECLPLAGLPLAVLSTWHIVVLALAILLLFGGRKLPELARGLARGMRIFRDELHGVSKDIQDSVEIPPPASPQKKVESKPADEAQEKKQ